MKKHIALILLVAVFGFPNALEATNPHLLSPPTVTDNGVNLTVSGSVAGLGNTVLTVISLQATGIVTTKCTNPGGKVVPGQSGPQNFSISGKYMSDANGRVNFSITTPFAKPGLCPNGNWTGDVTDVQFTSVKVYCNGTLIYQQ
jgi:hypothetical protein